ncbi:squalene synthase HpnC [Limibaculum sp. M0105]|uniref:Squalene synthase HpnC n=1 Tax=Thermohalobaculum xanthum TaxID=2753746 RepID=A0A8J7M3Y9_9RHOB|nr:squalene synthase HpnC [Thermohalobaculum xanthum]MBK0397739.1 squalene synthase HpnC [Thermohalobaculum xanthum]
MDQRTDSRAVEAPSGKWAGDENFPVGSRLIEARLRPHVMRYYAFARGTDDIADNCELAPEEKIARLDACEAGLAPGAEGPEIATRLRDSLTEAGVGDHVARDLLVAFRQDALKARYADWAELLEYCRYSAHPVGRFLLELHGEDARTGTPGDALCAALQVLNHLQDLGPDRRNLDRVYLPQDWMAEAGIDESALDAPAASAGLRAVIDRCLDGCDALLDRAEPLAGMIRSRRLAAEVAVIQRLARRLAARLRREDPLAQRVKHSRADLAHGLIAGLWRAATHRAPQ